MDETFSKWGAAKLTYYENLHSLMNAAGVEPFGFWGVHLPIFAAMGLALSAALLVMWIIRKRGKRTMAPKFILPDGRLDRAFSSVIVEAADKLLLDKSITAKERRAIFYHISKMTGAEELVPKKTKLLKKLKNQLQDGTRKLAGPVKKIPGGLPQVVRSTAKRIFSSRKAA